MIRRSNLIFIWGLIASFSGYFVLNFLVKSVSDKIAIISFIFSLGGALYGLIEQRKTENYKSIKETKDSIILELEDLKQYTLNEIKEIKYNSEKNDIRHDNYITLLTQQLEAIKIGFEHHIEEVGHLYTTKELLQLKEEIARINAVVNVQTKYTNIHLRVLNLENIIDSKGYKNTDSEKSSKEVKIIP